MALSLPESSPEDRVAALLARRKAEALARYEQALRDGYDCARCGRRAPAPMGGAKAGPGALCPRCDHEGRVKADEGARERRAKERADDWARLMAMDMDEREAELAARAIRRQRAEAAAYAAGAHPMDEDHAYEILREWRTAPADELPGWIRRLKKIT